MKKQLLSLCLPAVLAVASVPANAATILGFELGTYLWQADTSGSVGGNDVNALGVNDGDNSVTYFAFEHPVPLVPNAKIQLTDMSASAAGDTSAVDLGHTDATLYWEILDNALVSVDIGITQRAFDGEYNISGTTTTMTDNTYLAYGSAVVGIPATGLSVGMEVQQDLGVDDNVISDVKLRVMYEIVGGLGVELGQRTMTMTLKEKTPNTQDLEFDGSYIALTYTF